MNAPGVRIGEAAALYDLAPSAVRWWERQGVLSPPAREGQRRMYREPDLRRLGLAYLCCVTGMMPLAAAAIVTSDKGDKAVWQQTLKAEARRLEERIEQLTAARDYLHKLLDCTHDDPALCPMLDAELVQHTPRGRIPSPDLITAARAAALL